MNKVASPIHRVVGPRSVAPFVFAADSAIAMDQFAEFLKPGALEGFGISGLGANAIRRMMQGQAEFREQFAMDSDQQPLQTVASVITPIQFLQNWLTGFVYIITQARKIDELIGMTTTGKWEDSEIVQSILEQTGGAVLYGDLTNIPLASWNANYEVREVVRFEQGSMVGVLEAKIAARAGINTADQKRIAATLGLEINRNKVGFNGYNGGNGKTYGFLNDPNLPAATAFPNGALSSPLWSMKTFGEIQKDIRLMMAALRVQSGDTIDPKATKLTMALATGTIDYLTTTTDQGVSVQAWLDDAYPNVRVVSAPELTNAVASANEVYLYAENIADASTDNGRVFDQLVMTKFMLVGVQPGAKQYTEDYSNAMAGVLLKRPFAVIRRYGN